jgi:hypothetical protein
MAIDVVPLRPVPNTDILESIRGEASNVYQQNVPDATQASIEEVVHNIMDYPGNRNEFVNGLINLIGTTIVRDTSWTNPLAEFKQGFLGMGSVIQETKVGLPEAHTYSADRDYLEKDLFGQEPIEVQAAYHTIDRQEFFKVTISLVQLRRAFLSEQGLHSFMAQILESATTADNLGEFLATTSLFKKYYEKDGFFKVNVPDLNNPNSTTDDAKRFLRTARSTAGQLKYLSRHYNPAHMMAVSKPEDMVLFVTPEANAAMDVDGLAALFNVERGQVPNRIIELPQEYFGIPNCQGILVDKSFFVITDTFFEVAEVQNVVGLIVNSFLHHHEIISASPFANAIMFTTDPGDTIVMLDEPVTGITNIQVADITGTVQTDLERGSLFLVGADVVPVTANTAIRWEVISNTTGVKLSRRTYVTQNKVLHIGLDEDCTSVTLLAFAVDPATDSAIPQIKSSKNYAIVGEKESLFLESDSTPDEDGVQ